MLSYAVLLSFAILGQGCLHHGNSPGQGNLGLGGTTQILSDVFTQRMGGVGQAISIQPCLDMDGMFQPFHGETLMPVRQPAFLAMVPRQ